MLSDKVRQDFIVCRRRASPLLSLVGPFLLHHNSMLNSNRHPTYRYSSTSRTIFQSVIHLWVILRNAYLSWADHRLLVLDLLSVHLIRSTEGSTIISYHPSLNIPTTTAPYLHDRIRFAGKPRPFTLLFLSDHFIHLGQSVYWQSIFQNSPDPTFVLLTFLWHAMYGWDEALENLYEHICSLVSLMSLSLSYSYPPEQ